ncbi:hypothetical protein K1X84_00990 [bacterium]|nr:hypothetical protein [bacterium]
MKVQSFVTVAKKRIMGGAEQTLTGCPDPTNPNLGCTEVGCETAQVNCTGPTYTIDLWCQTGLCTYQPCPSQGSDCTIDLACTW